MGRNKTVLRSVYTVQLNKTNHKPVKLKTMKKQITILALAITSLFVPAVTGSNTVAAQEKQNMAVTEEVFTITHLSSTDEVSMFAVQVADSQLKNASLKMLNEKGDVLYSGAITESYTVFKLLTEEPAGAFTFVLYEGKKKLASRTWKIKTINETKIVVTESAR